MAFLHTPEFWVAVSFAGFVALLLYFRVPARVIVALDKRAAIIAAQLEEARRLRDEAESLLASYQQKQRDAEKQIQDIVTLAGEEAERLAKETREMLEQRLERRTRLAEQKIERAEAEAIRDVQTRAVEIAIEASRSLLAKQMTPERQDALVETAIGELNRNLR